MLNLETILVPVDFSERATVAAEHGVAIARRFHSQLLFVHSIPPSPYEEGAFESGYYTGPLFPGDEQMKAFVKKQLDQLVEKVFPDPRAEKLVVTGDPSRRIEEIIKARKVGLVVMPTHGYGPFRRFVLGSVTAKILHDVTCPVLTGAHVEEIAPYDPQPYRHIACAVDLSEQSRKVLYWAAEFAAAYKAKLSVIHVIQAVDYHGAHAEFFTPDLRKMLVENATEDVQELVDEIKATGNVFVEMGLPERAIPAFENNEKVDLLVIGRSADHGLLGRLRTHAYALIRESPCPVVSV
jgi:nucleotide-binding universal stress UspA family protein